MPAPDVDPHILQPGHAPTPFTAAEIREGCPAGRTVGVLIEPRDGDPYLTINTFVKVDEEGANTEVKSLTMDGEEIDPPVEVRSRWEDLQAHASFPAEQTEIAVDTLETPMGELRCKKYTVTDGPTSDNYWFAVEKPGMPVKVETVAPGGVAYRMRMINDNR